MLSPDNKVFHFQADIEESEVDFLLVERVDKLLSILLREKDVGPDWDCFGLYSCLGGLFQVVGEKSSVDAAVDVLWEEKKQGRVVLEG